MEYLRRNWVDLLMGLLIALVIGAVLFLLLSGGKLLGGRNTTVTAQPTTTPVSTPVVAAQPNSPEIAANQTVTTPKPAITKPKPVVSSNPPVKVNKPSSSSSTTKPVVSSSSTTKPVVSSSSTTKPVVSSSSTTKPVVSSSSTTKPVNPVETRLEVPNLPEVKPIVKPSVKPSVKPIVKPTSTPLSVKKPVMVATVKKPVEVPIVKKPIITTSKPRVTTSPKPKIVQKPANDTLTNKSRVTTQKPEPAITTPTSNTNTISRSSYLSNYRIVVATYKTQPRAETFAAQVRSQGFPARAVLSQGLYLVIVGPYRRQSAAESAFGRLQNAYPGAVLYSPSGARSGGARDTKPPQGSSNKSAVLDSKLATKPTKISTVARSIPSLSSTSQKIQTAYLQVGAFRNAASASPLLLSLRKAGYVARLRVTSDGVTHVIIGPLTGTPLELARADLRARGLSPFLIQ